jgi:hypothetical protein
MGQGKRPSKALPTLILTPSLSRCAYGRTLQEFFIRIASFSNLFTTNLKSLEITLSAFLGLNLFAHPGPHKFFARRCHVIQIGFNADSCVVAQVVQGIGWSASKGIGRGSTACGLTISGGFVLSGATDTPTKSRSLITTRR